MNGEASQSMAGATLYTNGARNGSSSVSSPDEGYVFRGQGSKYPRISRPVELMRTSYDVVVVGSGYGGGVAASRMARGDQSVCLLELGREKWPGEYPGNIVESLSELHVSGNFTPHDKKGPYIDEGDVQGLYHLILGQGQNAFVGKGLGGTSLLNANVFLEADQKTMAMSAWPENLRKLGALDKYYELARNVLQPEAYPKDFPTLPKLELLKRQAELLGLSNHFYRVPQTTRFENGPNSTGVEMQASTLTGQDSTGVNDGSKSSTLVNYLADAWNWGAEIFCDCEVRHVKKHPKEGYLIFFAWHGSKRAEFKNDIYSDLMWVHAKKFVFLGAGSLGTTEVLLRSRQMGLKMSKKVGTGMSGNGDILGFGYNTDYQVNSMGREAPLPSRPIGPTITGVIDNRDQPNPLDGFVIEEGAVPEALVPGLQAMLAAMPGKIPPENLGILGQIGKTISKGKSVVFGAYTPDGSTEKTQIYLIMSHDSNQAVMSLEDDKPVLKFLGVGRSEHVKFLNELLAKATNAVGGTFINNPFFAALGEQQITVHPIGGANISRDGTALTGATTEFGELLTGNGSEAHDGIVVVDGAVVPTALGVNPFATITALAERSVEAVAKKRGITIDYNTKNGVLDLFGPPGRRLSAPDEQYIQALAEIKEAQSASKEGLEFTEIMSGSIFVGDEIEDFASAAKAASDANMSARFYLSVHAWDVDTFLSNSESTAMLTGTFICPSLPGSPFMVLRGDFQLFNNDPRTPDTRNFTYNFKLISTTGEELNFNGYKIVSPSAAFSPLETWRATSTLYVTITRADNRVLGRGILHIQLPDLASEMKTLQTTGKTITSRIKATTDFLSYFTGQVARVFFAPFIPLQWPSTSTPGYKPSGSGIRYTTEQFEVYASDNVPSVMHVWTPIGTSSPSPIPLLFVPGAAVDHQIYALPTIPMNAIDYFTSANYTCYTVTHRTGITPVAEKGYTTFDARLDIRAALERIRSLHGPQPIYVVAHCAGSLALSMGLLDGSIPASWIKGITASNVFMDPIFGRVNMWKASLPVPLATVYQKVLGDWFACDSSKHDGILQQLLNQVLRFYPVDEKKEICNSVVCHRSELAFGRLWSHRNLSAATHSNLSHFLGGTSMTCLSHLVSMGKGGHVLNNSLESLVTDHNVSRLKGIPILFFSGSDNVVFSPESTSTSYFRLASFFAEGDYERVEFPGRGHLDCWMSEGAVEDVFPSVRAHVERCLAMPAMSAGKK